MLRSCIRYLPSEPHVTDAPSIARHVVEGVESVEAIERDPIDQRRLRQAEIDRDLPLAVLATQPQPGQKWNSSALPRTYAVVRPETLMPSSSNA